MRVALVSTYELGHQPLHVATPAARLLAEGHEVRCCDLAVEALPAGLADWAEAVAISVPMHTAMRLGLEVARRLRSARPGLPIAFYGLYAAVGADRTLAGLADRLIAGEYLDDLVAWLGDGSSGLTSDVGIHDSVVPARHLLPPLDGYARLWIEGEERVAGYVEASRGCRHRCRHCPVPVVYDGRFRIVDRQSVMEDVAQLVEMGAQHVTFGDPDFLNGPAHSQHLVEAVHASFPDLTFDITAKVEHLLAHEESLPGLVDAGLVFAVSAFETTNDRILGLLDKGHTAADMERAVAAVRGAGADLRSSWLPYTPWTTPDDLADIFEFVDRNGLWGAVDPVQLSIRLLIPEGSLLLDLPELEPHLGPYDHSALSYSWEPADPEVGVMQKEAARLAEESAGGRPATEILLEMWRQAASAASRPAPSVSAMGRPGPHLTEPWFCCAEPTISQLQLVGRG
jgi:hypothetical protein